MVNDFYAVIEVVLAIRKLPKQLACSIFHDAHRHARIIPDLELLPWEEEDILYEIGNALKAAETAYLVEGVKDDR